MPGLHAVLCSDGMASDTFSAALKDQRTDPWITAEELTRSDNFSAAFSGHSQDLRY